MNLPETSRPSERHSTVAAGPASPERPSFFGQPIAWAVLAIALVASAGGWFLARQHATLEGRTRFEDEANRIAGALNERMLIYEDVLHGAAGLYAASLSVERGEWRAYLESVGIERRFRGVDGVGFAAWVPRPGLEEFLRVTRADTPGFQVKGLGTNGSFIIIKYLEPETAHGGLVGHDLGAERQRRTGAEQARDTGRAVITGKMLLMEDGRGSQSGFMMLLPVYRRGQATGTIEEKRAAIEGCVFARFVTEQLMREVFGEKGSALRLEVADSAANGGDALIFVHEGSPRGRRAGHVPRFTVELPLTLAGREWRLGFSSTPAFDATVPKGSATMVAAGGGLISLLLFAIACSLSTTRARAVAMASEMTATLRGTNAQLQREIGERQRAEAVLQQLSALQEGILNSANYAIISTTTAGVVTTFNSTAERMLGRAALEVVGKATPALWHDPAEVARRAEVLSGELGRKVEPGFEAFVAKARTGGADENEWTFIHKDGSRFPVLLSVTALRDATDGITGFLGVIADITDRKRAEEALRQAKESAEEASRAKSQFLASMSHELRTPLNSVIGFANILLKNKSGNLTAAELNFLERIVANGKHLLALINQILDLSKIEARKVELQLAPVALDELVRETLAQEEGLVRDRPIALLAELPASVALLTTDADKLRQVLINLIGNALKFTERGSVTVRVKADPATHRPLQIEVADTGIGIARDKLRVVFEAFQQADAGTARKYGGTGLGLTISQALCKLMGYRLEVASEPGKGSTFSVIFGPSAAPAPVEPGPPLTPAVSAVLPPILRNKLVLVIDDEFDSRTLLEHMITECGCRVLAAHSADEGLRMAREFRPDLITVDLMMPLVDGWDVIRALKADAQLRAIPVVVVSVVAGENRGRILGAVDILQKPVAREALLAVLERNLPRGKPRLLVVDDEEDARRLLVSQLEEFSDDVRTAANGREALESLREFSPDLVLLDLVMPVMDGTAFLSALRAEPRFAHLPVVVITGKELTLSETEYLRLQAREVLRKADVFASDLKRLLAELLAADPRPVEQKGP